MYALSLSARWAATALICCLATDSSAAQDPCIAQTLVGSDLDDDRFGFRVAMHGNDLLVGSSRDEGDGTDAGAVYRYSLGSTGAQFEERWPGAFQAGSAVAIDSGWAAYKLDFGEVQTYQRVAPNSWQPIPLLASGSSAFGDALAINAGTTPRLAVADPFASPPSVRVFVFLSGTWFQEDTLLPSDMPPSFTSVAMINGTTVFAGAPSDAGSTGAVYVFQRSGSAWAQVQKIRSPGAPLGERFGEAIDVDGNTLVVGMPEADDGRIETYRRVGGNQWTYADAVFANLTGRLGAAVAISGERMVACSEQTGEVLSFQRINGFWLDAGRVTVGARANSITLDGGDFFVGEFGGPTSAGRVYSGAIAGSDCDNDGVFDMCEISAGTAPDHNENGVPDDCEGLAMNFCISTVNSSGNAAVIGCAGSVSVAANQLDLLVTGAGLNKPGLFIYGAGAIQSPFGDGFRCVSSGGIGVKRVNPIASTDATGSLVRSLNFTIPPFNSGSGLVTPGITRTFQYWFRDPMGPGGNGFNLTDGLSVTFTP